MTREDFDQMRIPPATKLVIEWACRQPPRAFSIVDIREALGLDANEAEMACLGLRVNRERLMIPQGDLDGIDVPADHPFRSIIGNTKQKRAA